MELKEVNNKNPKEPIIISGEDFMKAIKAVFPNDEEAQQVETIHTHFGTISYLNKTKD